MDVALTNLARDLAKIQLEKNSKDEKNLTHLKFLVDESKIILDQLKSPKQKIPEVILYIKKWSQLRRNADDFAITADAIGFPQLKFPKIPSRDEEFIRQLDAIKAVKSDIEFSKYATAAELYDDIVENSTYDAMAAAFTKNPGPREWIFRRSGFYSHETYRPLSELFGEDDVEKVGAKLKTSIIVLIWNVKEPLIFNVEKIINPEVARKYFTIGDCLSTKAVERFDLIESLKESKCKLPEYEFEFRIFPHAESEKFIVLESLNCVAYRKMFRRGISEFTENPFIGHDDILTNFNNCLEVLILDRRTKKVITSTVNTISKNVLVNEIVEVMYQKFREYYNSVSAPQNMNDVRNMLSWDENVTNFVDALSKIYYKNTPDISIEVKKELFALYFSKMNDLLGKLNKEIYQKAAEIGHSGNLSRDFVYESYRTAIRSAVSFILSNDNNIYDEMMKKGEIMRILSKG